MNVIVAPTGDLILVIDGELPTPDEWAEVFAAGYKINLLSMPGGTPTLDGLLPVAEHITAIAINSYSCSDLRAIDHMENLSFLLVGGRVTFAPNFERLPLLEFYSGPVKKFAPVLDLPSIRTLKLQWPSARPPKIAAPVEDLSIAGARNMVDLDVVEDPSKLKALEVQGAYHLDLGMMSAMTNLELAMFQDCKELTGGRALTHAPKLDRLFLENCPKIDDLVDLVSLPARVHVIGKNPFHQALRDRADRELWTFPPGAAYLPKDEKATEPQVSERAASVSEEGPEKPPQATFFETLFAGSQTTFSMTANLIVCGLVVLGGLWFGFSGDPGGFAIAISAGFIGALFVVYAAALGRYRKRARER